MTNYYQEGVEAANQGVYQLPQKDNLTEEQRVAYFRGFIYRKSELEKMGKFEWSGDADQTC